MNEFNDEQLSRLLKLAQSNKALSITPREVISEPVIESIYSTKHLAQPKPADFIIGIDEVSPEGANPTGMTILKGRAGGVKNLSYYSQLDCGEYRLSKLTDHYGDTAFTLPFDSREISRSIGRAINGAAKFITDYFERQWAYQKFNAEIESAGDAETFWRTLYPKQVHLLKGLRRSQRDRKVGRELASYFASNWEKYRRV